MGMNFGHMGWGAGSGGLFGYGATALWWLLAIVGAALLVRWIFGTRAGGYGRNDALETLAERYARGEIGREEFQNRKRDLGA
jgi:putative membrane protein